MNLTATGNHNYFPKLMMQTTNNRMSMTKTGYIFVYQNAGEKFYNSSTVTYFSWTTKATGWNQFGNTASWLTKQAGYDTFGNIAAWMTKMSGWNTFGSERSWMNVTEGWNIFGNAATWQGPEGYNTFQNISSWVLLGSGWSTFGNISSWDLIESGWNTFQSTPSWTNAADGWNTFTNQSSYLIIGAGWNTFGNVSAWVYLVTDGWNTFGNTPYWTNITSGWNTFGHIATWEGPEGWNTFQNISSFITIDSGWNTFGNGAWQNTTEGWNTFGNTPVWTNVSTGWNTFGNISAWQTGVDGWNTFRNAASWVSIDHGWNRFGNISTWHQYDQGWNTFHNLSYMAVLDIFPANGSLVCPTCYENDTFYYFNVHVDHTNGTLMDITWTTWNGTVIGAVSNVGNGTYHIVPIESVYPMNYSSVFNYTITVTDGVTTIVQTIVFFTNTQSLCMQLLGGGFTDQEFAVALLIVCFTLFFVVGYRSKKRSGGAFMLLSGFFLISLAAVINILYAQVFIVPFAVFIIVIGIRKWLFRPAKEKTKTEGE